MQVSLTEIGIGMPQEQLKRLGEHFLQRKNLVMYGLVISFKIIESHLGNVFVESRFNKGTVFNTCYL